MNSPASIQLNNNGTLQDLFTISDIVDFGTNSNGNYVRFSSGLQLCWDFLTTQKLSNTSRQAVWTFPVIFPAGTTAVVCNTRGLLPSPEAVYVAHDISTTTTSTIIFFYNVAGAIADTQYAISIAIGRWK